MNQHAGNRLLLSGVVLETPAPSHTSHGEVFCKTLLEVPRLSGVRDVLPVVMRQGLAQAQRMDAGAWWRVEGELRSYLQPPQYQPRLLVSGYIRTCMPLEAPCMDNEVTLRGQLYRAPVYRTTPLAREICDIMLAVPRAHGQLDVIPCIAWGAQARSVCTMQKGEPLGVQGRFQSRRYVKEMPAGSVERTAYEVSIMHILP
nr:single-stranded DNA-binding protein [Maliibacterium massiliense]